MIINRTFDFCEVEPFFNTYHLEVQKAIFFPAVLISSTLVGVKHLYYQTRSPQIPNAPVVQARNVCPVVCKKSDMVRGKKIMVSRNNWKPDAVGTIPRWKNAELDYCLLMASFHEIKSEINYRLTVSCQLRYMAPAHHSYIFICSPRANNLLDHIGGA